MDNKSLLELVDWLKARGYNTDVSSLSAALMDMDDGLDEIKTKLIPGLLKLSPSQIEDAADVTIDLWLESDHILRHAEDLLRETEKIRMHFDQNRE